MARHASVTASQRLEELLQASVHDRPPTVIRQQLSVGPQQ
jgi:hypothetical protein